MKLTFYQVDVFTNQAFGGNPLAVFPDADELTSDQMQKLALEMNLSETTFVMKPTRPDADYRVRIYTPRYELPFAGHPVIGTHWVLAKLGRTKLVEPVTTATFELGVGVLPATLNVKAGRVESVVMTQGKPEFGSVIEDIELIARGLGTNVEAIKGSGYPIQIVSTGTPQLIVCMRSLADVAGLDAGHYNPTIMNSITSANRLHLIAAFCCEAVNPGVDIHVRCMAPSLGILEDPATGSANGGLGAYIVKHGLLNTDQPTVKIRSEQGLEMGRPSFLDIEVDHDNRQPHTVRVGGSVVPILEGTVTF
ncbi:PhzF family phenazine biosynthesis protein [bacterium]|nr:MAG: PhzF family phenazine biosynthesis protein [bacterium]